MLHSQLLNDGVKAIYVDSTLNQDTHIWYLIKGGIGTDYEEVYSGKPGIDPRINCETITYAISKYCLTALILNLAEQTFLQ